MPARLSDVLKLSATNLADKEKCLVLVYVNDWMQNVNIHNKLRATTITLESLSTKFSR